MLPHRFALAAIAKSSLAWASLTTLGIFTVLHQTTGLPVPVPEGGLLPVTLGGWVGMLTGVFSLAAVIIHAWKNPAERVAHEMDRKISEMERRIDKQLALLVADMSNAEIATERRLSILRETDEAKEVRMRVNETSIAVANRERDYLRTGIEDLRGLIQRSADDAAKHNERILSALVRIAGGRRGMPPIHDEDDH